LGPDSAFERDLLRALERVGTRPGLSRRWEYERGCGLGDAPPLALRTHVRLDRRVTSQGSPYGRFRRALDRGLLLEAEASARELGSLSLTDALDYCDLLARLAPDRYERAALRWHGRWEAEGKPLSLREAQLALTCLQLLTDGDRAIALTVLRHLAKR
jgi:hypothetical protein